MSQASVPQPPAVVIEYVRVFEAANRSEHVELRTQSAQIAPQVTAIEELARAVQGGDGPMFLTYATT